MGRETLNHFTTLPVTRKSFNTCNLFIQAVFCWPVNLEKLFQVTNRHWLSASLRNVNKGTFHVCISDFIAEQVHVVCCAITEQWKKWREKEGKFYPWNTLSGTNIWSFSNKLKVLFRIFTREKGKLGGGKLVSQKDVCAALYPTQVSRTEGRRVHCTQLHWHLWSGIHKTSFSFVKLGRGMNETLADTVF